jgi:hypothetical protein
LSSNFFSVESLWLFWVMPNGFSQFSRQIGYLSSKLTLTFALLGAFERPPRPVFLEWRKTAARSAAKFCLPHH